VRALSSSSQTKAMMIEKDDQYGMITLAAS